jgi:NAD(P)H-hydrate epimerase
MTRGREIISVEQMRRIDARSAELGVSTRTLMENAGAAVAEVVLQRCGPGPVLVLCGPGNNGGDGFVAARKLAEAGRAVRLALLGDVAALKGDAASAAAAWKGSVGNVEETAPQSGEIVVDALFGAGLSRPLDGASARLADLCHSHRVVAVDTPSGLPGDGTPPQGAVFRTDLTATFVRKKPAHLLLPGRALCGETIVADIGSPEAALAEAGVMLWENSPELWELPWPGLTAHKHARGHAMVVTGGAGKTGAGRLAARAALRVGAGLVTALSPPDAAAENAAHLTAIMLTPWADVGELVGLAVRASAVLIGPAAGLSAETRAAILALAGLGAPLVLDADALTLFQDDPAALFGALPPGCVMTPHLGEFRRLFPDLAASAASKVEQARAAAVRAGAIVLLKGPDTVVAAPDGRAVINAVGSPFLATAGSGDVLAGLILGLMSQGMAGFEAAAAGAWLHGRCGERLGPGLIAEDLSEALPFVLDALAPGALRAKL